MKRVAPETLKRVAARVVQHCRRLRVFDAGPGNSDRYMCLPPTWAPKDPLLDANLVACAFSDEDPFDEVGNGVGFESIIDTSMIGGKRIDWSMVPPRAQDFFLQVFPQFSPSSDMVKAQA
ncbi:hypothetical protein HNP46_000316 [Pseudomonas nitritireducens]|uniref:Uncharacterized protein n=1 Tax=Pseudomonas nitroreducens TaxID=46680 RepID=A0A7W7KEQ7_PSENT|nr:hypothetical protein [Pseudomonas nitritireducens]MBB4861505.1 hypothetical protein [Pseudomonas nitritireducens]